MKIVVDAMGGDQRPRRDRKGRRVRAFQTDKELKVVLTGDEAKISPVPRGAFIR